jgi:flagellar protein FlaG
MANDISSMVMAQQPAPTAQKSSQFVKLEAANVSDAGGQDLPVQGKELPIQGKALPQQTSEKETSASSSELQDAVNQINEFVQSVQRDLSFSMDEASGRTIIKVIDSESGKLVRQIPSEEVLALATYLHDVNKETASAGTLPSGILFSDST